MEKRVRIKFGEPVWALPRTCGGQVDPPVYGRYFGPIGLGLDEQGVGDAMTRIRVVATAQPVRRIVTDYLPLSEYRRILWVSETHPPQRRAKSKLETTVHHYGPADLGHGNRNALRIRSSHDPEIAGELQQAGTLSFSWGEVAYAYNRASFDPNSEDNSSYRATQFIESRMKERNPLQVRWAMFYLGKWRFDEGIPVLLKYIDYRYTSCGILEESYPALKALRQIGKPAAEAALKAITTETKDLRIELLCNAVVSVEGLDKTKKLLDQRVADAKNTDEKKRYQQALKHFEAIKAKQLELDSIKETPVDQPEPKKGK